MKKMSSRNLANSSRNASGSIVKAGEEFEKNKVLSILPERYRKAHQERLCHMHDLEFYHITYNCIGVNVIHLIGNKKMSFRAAIRKLNREIIVLTNMQSGGIGLLDFDADMGRYVEKETMEELSIDLRELFCDLNVFSRKGCEKPYVTFNFGIGDSENARKVSLAILRAYEMGDENGKPFIFPNLVFKLQSKVNMDIQSPNHFLYREALKCTSKRMVPTYFNCDSQSNKSANPSKIGIMGCRTRVVDNLYGEKSGLKRGNVACVTLNLVQMAYESVGNLEKFLSMLKQAMNDAKDSLLYRYKTLLEKADFTQVYHMVIYKDSEYHSAEKMLRNGTLSIGFIGLWDALSVLYQQEWNCITDMEPYLEEALHIVHFMRSLVDLYGKETGLNFSLLASAAEGVTGRFAKYDSVHKGKGKKVAQKGYYSNSFHVPVTVETDYIEKILFEGKFHELCNGGSITYVELDEMPDGNIEAVQEIVEFAYKNDCNYIGLNFPLDNCNDCDYVGKVLQKCPCCGSSNVRRLRRVSGYLAEVERFVFGKKFELMDRVNHNN